jgi:hypothetical protein
MSDPLLPTRWAIGFVALTLSCNPALQPVKTDAPVTDAPIADAPVTDRLTAVRPFGVNMNQLLFFYLGLQQGGATTARQQLHDAAAMGATYARLSATPYWPNDMTGPTGWVNHPDAYFAAFDAMIADARAAGVHLLPSFLWLPYLFCDIAGEPRGKFFEPDSASRALFNQFVTAVVSRYKDNNAIFGWEIGNEFNFMVDAAIGSCNVCNGGTADHNCYLAPSLGTPCQRTDADLVYLCNSCRGVSSAQEDIQTFTAEVATLIRSIDTAHHISSGNAMPGQAQWHLAHSSPANPDYTWDTPAEFDEVIGRFNPPPIDLLSVHLGASDFPRFGPSDPSGSATLLHLKALAAAANQQFYIGEYGEPGADRVCNGVVVDACGGDPSRQVTSRMMDDYLRLQIPFASIWTFDYLTQACGTGYAQACFSFDAQDQVATWFTAHDLATTQCAGALDGTACAAGTCQSEKCTSPAPVAVVTTVSSVDFTKADAASAWAVFTNCTSCKPGTFTYNGAGYFTLASFDLACTGDCSYPGVRAFGPRIAVTPGLYNVRFTARASSAHATPIVSVFQDETESAFHLLVVQAAMGTDFVVGGDGDEFPAAVAGQHGSTKYIRLSLQLLDPNATLDLQQFTVERIGP